MQRGRLGTQNAPAAQLIRRRPDLPKYLPQSNTAAPEPTTCSLLPLPSRLFRRTSSGERTCRVHSPRFSAQKAVSTSALRSVELASCRATANSSRACRLVEHCQCTFDVRYMLNLNLGLCGPPSRPPARSCRHLEAKPLGLPSVQMNTLNHNVFAVRNKEAFHDVISSGNYGLVEMQVATVANKATSCSLPRRVL